MSEISKRLQTFKFREPRVSGGDEDQEMEDYKKQQEKYFARKFRKQEEIPS
jgi:hypothetical protein